MKRIACALLSLAALSLSTPAQANGLYVAANGGLAVPVDSYFRAGGIRGNIETDPGWTAGAAVGLRAFHYVRTELAESYREFDTSKIKSKPAPTLSGGGDASALTPMANVYVDTDFDFPVQMYVGGGIGVAFLEANNVGSSSFLRVDDETSEFAYNFMTGMTWDPFNSGLKFDLGYKWLGTSAAKFDATLVGVGATHAKVDIGIHEFNLGARYEF